MVKRRALLVGNMRFEHTDFSILQTPKNDVEDLESVLREHCGFEVITTLIDQSSRDILAAIEDLFSNAEKGELVLFYYSGHGFKERDGYYLTSKDTNKRRPISTGIPHRNIHMALNNSQSKHRIIILDCCYSGGFTQDISKGGADNILLEELKGESTIILTSSSKFQLSFEDIGRNSLFTQYLIEGIVSGEADANKDGRISIDELFEYTNTMVRLKRSNQTPLKDSTVREGEIIIATTDRTQIATLYTNNPLSYQIYTDKSIPLPISDYEKLKIAIYLYELQKIDDVIRVIQEIKDDAFRRDIADLAFKKGDIDIASRICTYIQSSTQLRIVINTLIDKGYVDSEVVLHLIDTLRSKASEVELRNVAIHLYNKGLEASISFRNTWMSMNNMAELKKIPQQFIYDNRYEDNTFMDIIEKIGERNRAELSKIAFLLIQRNTYTNPQFDRILEILANKHIRSFINVIKELQLHNDEVARVKFKTFLPILPKDYPEVKNIQDIFQLHLPEQTKEDM